MSMSGVVIWYSRKDFRAIIWCEDGEDLGVATGRSAWRNPLTDVSIGDYVMFRPQTIGRDRQCRDIELVEHGVAPSLPATLRHFSQGVARPKVSRNPPLHLCASRD
ncbi:MAG: hypothetical protein JXR75_05680 [Rhodobacteraceae bacterium]|nr:hypothetical protein [Paracoccaceae bacterium]